MAVREFTATTDRIDCSGGALGNYAEDAFTLVTVTKPLVVASHQHGFMCPRVNGGAVLALMYSNNGGIWAGGDSGDQSGAATDPLTVEWQVFGYDKGNGTTVIRSHRSPLDSVDWSHSNSSGTLSDVAGTCDLVRFGSNDFGFDPEHRQAVSAVFTRQLSDAEWETILSSQALLDLGPAAMWHFNQTSVADDVLDLTGGGADETAISGTTVVTGDDPTWDFSLEAPAEKQSYYAPRARRRIARR